MLGVVSGKTEVHEMLSGVMLIIVTMFAVLGAYYSVSYTHLTLPTKLEV